MTSLSITGGPSKKTFIKLSESKKRVNKNASIRSIPYITACLHNASTVILLMCIRNSSTLCIQFRELTIRLNQFAQCSNCIHRGVLLKIVINFALNSYDGLRSHRCDESYCLVSNHVPFTSFHISSLCTLSNLRSS